MKDLRTLCDEAIQLWDADCEMDGVISEMRAALAQPEPPVEGEVGELVNSLRHSGDALRAYGLHGGANDCTRAADLLSQRHPAPVPVAERLPGPEDCDEEGRCWWFNPGQPAMSNPHIATSSWRLCRMLSGKPMGTHWLPARALSLPAGEPQP